MRSTDVRAAIAAGDLATAARLLGRPHAVVGDATPEDGGTTVRFELPVALPATGDYPAAVDGIERTVHAEDGIVRVWACETCGSLASVDRLARTRADRDVSAPERRRFSTAR